jgi:hypothetical protein
MAANWHTVSKLRRENEELRRDYSRSQEAQKEIQAEAEGIARQNSEQFILAEVLQLRARVQSLQQELEAATRNIRQPRLGPEETKLALTGAGSLPRRVIPPVGPLPKDFEEYRLEMRYGAITPVLQKREPDGGYTDVLEGAREIGLGEKHLFIRTWPDPSRMDGTWVTIDLDTGEMTEDTGRPPEDTPEGKVAKWIRRDPDANRLDDQNWKVLFK